MSVFNRILGDTTAGMLEKALAGSSLRHKVIGNNIANVNTPGFKRSEVSFENELAAASKGEAPSGLTRTNAKHLSPKTATVSPTVTAVTNNSLRTDGNNVDIDAEMAAMAKNNVLYNAIAQRLGNYYTNLKSAIKGG